MVGTGVGARQGILIKDAAVLERVGSLDAIVLDKTGTLTVGRPEVTDVVSVDEPGRAATPREDVLRLAAAVESLSEHPLARAIVRAWSDGALPRAAEFAGTTGGGVRALVEGRLISVAKPQAGQAVEGVDALRAQGKTVVVVSAGDRPIGVIAMADRLKPGATDAVAELHRQGLATTLMTGDHAQSAQAIAAAVGISHVQADLVPQDKVARIGQLRASGQRVAMVGDGINDAPALAASDVGIAMGTGADIAKEAGDIVLVSGELSLVPTAIRLSRAMMGRIRLGLFWAFAYNIVLIPLAALGYLHPMLAAAAMSLSSVSVVANALTLRSFRPMRSAPGAPTQ
jgi:Cu+-exporting ATPase